jgi:hypothetical protein
MLGVSFIASTPRGVYPVDFTDVTHTKSMLSVRDVDSDLLTLKSALKKDCARTWRGGMDNPAHLSKVAAVSLSNVDAADA